MNDSKPSKEKVAMSDPNIIVIIDALDECGTAKVHCYVLSAFREFPLPTSFLVAGCSIERDAFRADPLGWMTRYLTLDDCYRPDDHINVSLKSKFDGIVQNYALPDLVPLDWRPSDFDLANLSRKSSMLFIYASTLMKCLDSFAESITISLRDISSVPAAQASCLDDSVESVLQRMSGIQAEWLIVFDNTDEPPVHHRCPTNRLSKPGLDVLFAELDALYNRFSAVENVSRAFRETSSLRVLKQTYTPISSQLFENILASATGGTSSVIRDFLLDNITNDKCVIEQYIGPDLRHNQQSSSVLKYIEPLADVRHNQSVFTHAKILNMLHILAWVKTDWL
jgi:hypothetical protein